MSRESDQFKMKIVLHYLASIIILFSLKIMAFPLLDFNIQPEKMELKEFLEGCARYCEKMDNLALHYVCQEQIKEMRYHPAVGYTNDYLYDYQLIRKNNIINEERTLLKENGRKKNEKNAKLKTRLFYHKNIIYGPYTMLSRSRQKLYHYRIVKEDKIEGEKAIVLEAKPRSKQANNELYGKIWVEASDFSVIKIEWTQNSIENFKVTSELSESMGTIPELTIKAEYKIKKKEIRFPSKFSIIEAYIKPRTVRITRSKTSVEYYDYKFFTVETEVRYLK